MTSEVLREEMASSFPSFSRSMATVFYPYAVGNFLSLVFRNINAVATSHIVQDVALDVSQAGLLSSVYFLAFAAAQLPVGLALDRFGPKRVQIFLLSIAALGSLLFSAGNSFMTLLIGRSLIGLGLAGCFMSSIKAVSLSFAPHRLPLLTCCMIAIGGLGSMASTMPVEWILNIIDWRNLFRFLSSAIAFSVLLTLVVAPDRRDTMSALSISALSSMKQIWNAPSFRSAATLFLLSHTVFFGLQGLWLGQWLRDVGGLDPAAASSALLWSMAGVVVGSLSVGAFSQWAQRRRLSLLEIGASGVILFIMIQAAAAFGARAPMLFIAIGFTITGSICSLDYSIAAQSVPKHLIGRATTLLNLLIFLGSFVVQWAFGAILTFWTPDLQLHYPPAAYSFAFSVFALLQTLAVGVWVIGKQKRTRHA